MSKKKKNQPHILHSISMLKISPSSEVHNYSSKTCYKFDSSAIEAAIIEHNGLSRLRLTYKGISEVNWSNWVYDVLAFSIRNSEIFRLDLIGTTL